MALVLQLSVADRNALSIDSMMRYSTPAPAPPVDAVDKAAPVGGAIGVAVGITVAFVIVFIAGMIKYSKETPQNLAALRQQSAFMGASASQHFSLSGAGRSADVASVVANNDSFVPNATASQPYTHFDTEDL